MKEGWKAKNIETEENVAERLQQIIRRLADDIPGRINGMLSPEFISYDEDTLTSIIAYEGKDWEKNQREEIHGGTIAAMFDTAMGFTIAALDGTSGLSTADIQISYIKAFKGAAFLFETEIVYIGNRNIRVRGVAYDRETRNTLAICTSTFARNKKAW